MAKKKEVIPTVDELAERIREAMKNQGTCSASLKVIGLTLEQLHVAEDDPFMKLMEGVANIAKG